MCDRRAVLAGLAAGAAVTWAATAAIAGGGQVPRVESLRFQLIGNEPVAGPDGRATVAGWSVLMFRDRTAQQCYVVFREGTGSTAAQPAACP